MNDDPIFLRGAIHRELQINGIILLRPDRIITDIDPTPFPGFKGPIPIPVISPLRIKRYRGIERHKRRYRRTINGVHRRIKIIEINVLHGCRIVSS